LVLARGESKKARWFVLREQRVREVYLKNYAPVPLFLSVSVLTLRSPTSYQDGYRDFLGVGKAYFDPTVDMLYIGPSASCASRITPAPINTLSAMPWLKNVKTLACEFWGREVRYELEQDIAPPISLLPPLEKRIIVVGDVAEYTMPQSGLKWSNRPQGELEFINPDDAWTKIVEECFDGWYNEVAKAKRPKLTVKKSFTRRNRSEGCLGLHKWQYFKG
jgi:hypothetical protein